MRDDIENYLNSWKSTGYHDNSTKKKSPFVTGTYYHIGYLNSDNSFHYQGVHLYNKGFSEDNYPLKPFPSHYVKITTPLVPEVYEYYTGDDLWDADPNCKHILDPKSWSGIKCLKCGGWFCY